MPEYTWRLGFFLFKWAVALCSGTGLFFLKPSACSTSSPGVWVSFSMHGGAAGRGGTAWGCSRSSVPCARRGELRGIYLLHGWAWDTHCCWGGTCRAGSVLIEHSSLRRGSLCSLLAHTDPQSCWAALFCFFAFFFFLPEGFIFFHVSTFHLSPWARNDYHLNNYTWVCFYSYYLAGL